MYLNSPPLNSQSPPSRGQKPLAICRLRAMSWGVRHLSWTRHVGPLAGLHKDLSRSLPLAGFHDLEGNGLERPMGIKTKRGTDIGHHLQPSCSANVAFDGDPASQVRAEDFAFPQSTPRCRTVNKAMRCQASIASSLWMNPPEVPPGAKWPVDADHTDPLAGAKPNNSKAATYTQSWLKAPEESQVPPKRSMDSVRIYCPKLSSNFRQLPLATLPTASLWRLSSRVRAAGEQHLYLQLGALDWVRETSKEVRYCALFFERGKSRLSHPCLAE